MKFFSILFSAVMTLIVTQAPSAMGLDDNLVEHRMFGRREMARIRRGEAEARLQERRRRAAVKRRLVREQAQQRREAATRRREKGVASVDRLELNEQAGPAVVETRREVQTAGSSN